MALVMTELAQDHAASRPVRSLASRTAAAQGPVKAAMSAWLEENGDTDGGGHDHTTMSTMPKTATAVQPADHGTAHGTAFDRFFLPLLTAHRTAP